MVLKYSLAENVLTEPPDDLSAQTHSMGSLDMEASKKSMPAYERLECLHTNSPNACIRTLRMPAYEQIEL